MLDSNDEEFKVTRLASLEFLVRDDNEDDLYNVTCFLTKVELKEEDPETTTYCKPFGTSGDKSDVKEVNGIYEFEDEDLSKNLSLMEAMGLPTSFINPKSVCNKKPKSSVEASSQQAWTSYWFSEGLNVIRKVFTERHQYKIPDNDSSLQLSIFYNASLELLNVKSSENYKDNISGLSESVEKSEDWIIDWKICCEEQTKYHYDLFMQNYERRLAV